MANAYRNSHLPIIIAEIKNSPVYRRFLDVLRDYDIRAICDSHAHVSSGREEAIGEPISKLMPKFPLTVGDINHLYDELFGKEGIDFASVVFDSPLAAYDLAKRNDQLLAELRETNHKGLTKAIPFTVVTPEMTAEQIEGYVERGAKGFKMSPRTSSPYVRRGVISDVSLAEMLNPEALRVANLYGLPLVVHLPQLVVSPRMKPSLREELGQVAIRYPHLKVILAHLGQAQSPGKIEDLLDWIEKNDLAEIIWMDISAVTVPSVLEMAFSSKVKLLFGTDIDFSITERGRYIMFRYEDGQRVLADDYERGSVITALVSTSFGDQLKGFAAENGIDLDAPMLIFQLEGILDAIDRLQRRGKDKAEVKLILENLFFRNAGVLVSSGNS